MEGGEEDYMVADAGDGGMGDGGVGDGGMGDGGEGSSMGSEERERMIQKELKQVREGVPEDRLVSCFPALVLITIAYVLLFHSCVCVWGGVGWMGESMSESGGVIGWVGWVRVGVWFG